MKRPKRAKPWNDTSRARSPASPAKENCSQTLSEEVTAAPRTSAARWPTLLAAALIVLSAAAAYHDSLFGPFVYDDLGAIEKNQTIRRLWPIWPVLSPPCNGETVGGRPLLNLSLAINYALGGLDVWGYHATNLLIHIAAALLLFGILRRTFLTPTLRARFGNAATPLALAGALVWTLHPLHTESITYIAQRAESLVGLFYLLTLYCVIRGAGTVPLGSAGKGTVPFSLRENRDSPQLWPRLWYVAAVLACLLGMATKEVMVTAPLIVLLYDRTFLAGSFIGAWRRRWGLYLGLAATWGLLGYLVLSTGLIGRQPEMGAPDAWSYARTQPGVILHYLRLSIWPKPLCFDYAWPVADTLQEILPGTIAVGLLLAVTIWGLIGRKAYGFLGAWFFLILAPTSSIMPLGQLAFEHRMYLSLAAVAVLAAAGGYILWDRLLPRPACQGGQSPFSPPVTPGMPGLQWSKKGTVPAGAIVLRWVPPVVIGAAVLLALGCATAARNWDYRSALAIYQDTVDKRPLNPVAHNNLAFALAELGRTDEAIRHCQQALRLKPEFAEAHNNLGLALAGLGKTDEAIQHYQQALQLKPGVAEAHNNFANALTELGRTDEAIPHYQQALWLSPGFAEAHNNLGSALLAKGRSEEAIQQCHEALRLKPNYPEAHNNFGLALAACGESAQAIQQYHQALRFRPAYAEAHNNLANVLANAGRTDEAIEHYQEALRLRPDYPEAHNNLAASLAALGRTDEAVKHFREALRLKPDFAAAHSNLGNALVKVGNSSEAIEHFREALRLKPDYPPAHYNLANALANAGQSDEAMGQYHEALRLKPDYAEARNNLGTVLAKAGRAQQAIEQWEETLRLRPDYADAHFNSASVLDRLGRTQEAVEHYEKFLQLLPDSVAALRKLAWLLATHEPGAGGDPARAVGLAERLCELAKQEDARYFDTLAAAYAAAGRFPDAVVAAEKALRLAESTAQAPLAEPIRARLELYRAGRPYRQPPR